MKVLVVHTCVIGRGCALGSNTVDKASIDEPLSVPRGSFPAWRHQKLFGGLSMACDFADLVQPGDYSVTTFPAQNDFCTRPVALLQGAFGPRSCTSPAVSRRNIHPPNSF